MFRFIVLIAAVSAASAGLIAAPGAYSPYSGGIVAPAITSQSDNILRSYGNLGQISTFSKTIDTPFSSVSKSDVRVSNPGYAVGAAAYGAPLAHAAYGAPLAHAAFGAPLAHAAYAAPAYTSYAHAPIAKAVGVAPVGGLLGVAYSAAPAVAHMTYSNGLGFGYNW